MCGIVGVAGLKPISCRSWLAIGRDAISHRGPDDAGEWWSHDGKVGLAHRRLSIIDLSSAGHQPMHDHSGSLSIVFNGEIYNFIELRDQLMSLGHKFKSDSDTEVILVSYLQWGTDCLDYLNGMFAFSIFDSKKQKIFLARDRAGEKPMFYHHSKGVLRFASELKALFADPDLPLHIDHEAFDCYLSMGYVPGKRCILQNFNKLPPGHALLFDLKTGTLRDWCYWKLPDYDNKLKDIVNESELLDEIEHLLEDSVRRQMIADVPVGVLLSGGVDSSLITSMAVRVSSNVKTFTVGFPGYGELDETKHARLIAEYFGTQHTELIAELPSSDLLIKLANQYDEPIIDSSMIPTYLVSQLIHKHCKVALGGDGGDELFGGYGHYSRIQWLKKKLTLVPSLFRKPVSFMAREFLQEGFAGSNLRAWLIAIGHDFENELPQITKYFDSKTRKKLMKGYSNYGYAAEQIYNSKVISNGDILQRSSRQDFHNYLPEDILVKVDRASMLNSLEIRAPLLDYRLIEFAFGQVPSHLKATEYDKKILLKKLTSKVLPPEFDQKRKQGFSIPLDEWLKGKSFNDLFYDVLCGSQSIFDTKVTSHLLNRQDKGDSNGERLFGLVMFELWRKKYGISF